MATLMDTVRIEPPKRSPVRPASPLDPSWDVGFESRSSERSFEVESRGGYARTTVVGRLAYFDDEAQTYMVLTRDGVLVRIPLRDIACSRGVPRKSTLSGGREASYSNGLLARLRPQIRRLLLEE